MTMTTQTPAVNFKGLSLTFKEESIKIKYLDAFTNQRAVTLTFENRDFLRLNSMLIKYLDKSIFSQK